MDILLDHYSNPRNYGRLKAANVDQEGVNPICGDRVRIQASVNDKGIVEAVRFTGSGCTVSIASTSLLTTLVEGLAIEEAVIVSAQQLMEAIAAPLSPRRYECVVLGYNLLRAGLVRLYHERRLQAQNAASG